MSDPAWLSEGKEGVTLALHVQPRASRNEILIGEGEELRLRLTSPPVDGAANKLCCQFLASLCGVAKGRVKLRSGDKSRHKRVSIEGVSKQEVLAVLQQACK
ncbi:MAG: YggU family protein [Desulfuromonas sp.]|nr:MAG: YggU family protein [Desulfuromonas sp.]